MNLESVIWNTLARGEISRHQDISAREAQALEWALDMWQQWARAERIANHQHRDKMGRVHADALSDIPLPSYITRLRANWNAWTVGKDSPWPDTPLPTCGTMPCDTCRTLWRSLESSEYNAATEQDIRNEWCVRHGHCTVPTIVACRCSRDADRIVRDVQRKG